MRTAFRTAILVLLSISACCAGPLDDLARARDYQSGRVSSVDPSGGNADGMQWKPMKSGEMRILADISGPGAISHIWFTLAPFNEQVLKGLVIRMYWDDEKTPSVEVPIGEFFGLGHGKAYNFDSLPFAVGNGRGLNCFFEMPFRKRARITLGNQGSETITDLYYYIDYKRFTKPQDDLLYFHAQYRQSKPTVESGNYIIMEASGRGHYVGCFYNIRGNSPGWWGEGDDMIYIDGSREPTLAGTGTEDYFCQAWMMAQQSGLRFGAPLYELAAKPDGNVNTLYRFHLEDAVAFRKSIKVTIEHGHANDRQDDVSSVAYWYQTEPHAAFSKLPLMDERRDWSVRVKELLDKKDYTRYRQMQQELLGRAGAKRAREDAIFNIGESYRLEGDLIKAEEIYRSLLGGIPEKGAAMRVTKALKDMGKDAAALQASRLFIVSNEDGRVIPTQKDGAACYKTDLENGSPYIYFDVNDQWLKDTNQLVLLEIEYFDEGNLDDSFAVEYDSNIEGSEIEQSYHRSPVFTKPGVKGWRKAILALESARFGGRQNGSADFRITCFGQKDQFIRSVQVIPELPAQEK